MTTAIIIPTINVPTNLTDWAAMLDAEKDFIVVVGSGKTPHDEVKTFIETLPVYVEYMHPDEPVSNQWEISKHLERNHHHRRNLALLRALQIGKTRGGISELVTIDDDNYPVTSRWLDSAKRLLAEPNQRITLFSHDGWWNAGELCEPKVTHRGYPLSQRLVRGEVNRLSPSDERIGVVASLWRGDPDIDAIERIAVDPQVKFINESVTLASGTWCPFDSQSTTVAGALAPLLYMWTGVGRYDDIWASYLMRTVMDPLDWHVTYGYPLVDQRRNEHNLLRDLENELFGLRFTEELCLTLRNISHGIECNYIRANDVLTTWDWWTIAVDEMLDRCGEWLPRNTMEGLRAWMRDVESLELNR